MPRPPRKIRTILQDKDKNNESVLNDLIEVSQVNKKSKYKKTDKTIYENSEKKTSKELKELVKNGYLPEEEGDNPEDPKLNIFSSKNDRIPSIPFSIQTDLSTNNDNIDFHTFEFVKARKSDNNFLRKNKDKSLRVNADEDENECEYESESDIKIQNINQYNELNNEKSQDNSQYNSQDDYELQIIQEIDDLFLFSTNEDQDLNKSLENLDQLENEIVNNNPPSQLNTIDSPQVHEKNSSQPKQPKRTRKKNLRVANTNDLLNLLPRRRRVKNGHKRKNNHDKESENEEDNIIKNDEDTKTIKSKKIKNRKGMKKIMSQNEGDEVLDEVAQREHEARIRYFEEVDKYILPVEVIEDKVFFG
ncbi:2770_t:CDS:2 [Diversispora eburnea]|uniref:2770_t:CDS:1 n=1 Tax=Diversispora eburnea TaxID=1213867 RepID=A0A9N9FY15_9GLOM|nr:2770_t:CDS:2 [Diversispora eburnea]